MSTALWLKRINVLLFVLVVLQAITGLTGIFAVIHPFGGILLVLAVAAHLYLNRAWIKATYFKKK